MAVTLLLDRDDLLACRFAVSPLHETTAALRLLAQPARQGYHLPWVREVRAQLTDTDLGPLVALLGRPGYHPDFLSPPPRRPLGDIEDELARVRAVPARQVAGELRRWRDEHRGRLPAGIDPDDPAGTRDRLADALGRCWQRLVAPWWPRLLDLLESDVTYRARRLADGGVGAAVADLHRDVRWRAGALRVGIRALTGTRALGGTGLLLMPTAFGWPGLGVMLDPPWQPTLVYPARGVAGLWEQRPRDPAALAALVGRTRAALLRALAEPASTTGLARRCGLPASTVSEQVAVLRAAGLVLTRTVGRSRVHERTALGVALASSSG